MKEGVRIVDERECQTQRLPAGFCLGVEGD